MLGISTRFQPRAGRLAISFLVFASFVLCFLFFCIEASQTNLFLYQISSFTIVKFSFIASIITTAMILCAMRPPYATINLYAGSLYNQHIFYNKKQFDNCARFFSRCYCSCSCSFDCDFASNELRAFLSSDANHILCKYCKNGIF